MIAPTPAGFSLTGRALGRLAVVFALLVILAPAGQLAAQTPESVEEVVRRALFTNDPWERDSLLAQLAERGNPDVAPALITALRFVRGNKDAIAATLLALTGADHGESWHDWMLWQEAHPEITPFDGFDGFKADVMAEIDVNFRAFLRRGVKHEIRLEEITWGGVMKGGIPALVNPTHYLAEAAGYLVDEELVFGVEINGDARAYPLRILDWHEMFNDVVGGVPVALAYCTLCGSGILYETSVPPRPEPFVFGSSGFLYRSNKLMYDQQTHSLWNQFTGRPVVGPLTGSGITLRVRPVAITSWAAWRARHPDTRVLSLNTGYARDYTLGRPYGSYFASPDLMFPALVEDQRLKPKDYVFVLRAGTNEKAWPLSAFTGRRVINDAVGDLDVVLVGDEATRTVRAYDAGGRDFNAGHNGLADLIADGEIWRVGEEALTGEGGAMLPRLPGHIAYWFAWSGFNAGASFYED